jgi:hypothetical protein
MGDNQKKERGISSPKDGGLFYGLTSNIKLILRLLADSRISPWLKLLPIGSLVYLVVPDLAPGPIDDAAAIWLGSYLFIELCPPAIVQEHLNAINRITSQKNSLNIDEDDIVDAEYWEEK